MKEQVAKTNQVRLDAIALIVSMTASVIASVCAIVTSSATMNAVRTAAEQRVFEKKLDACDGASQTAIELALAPASAFDDPREKQVLATRVIRIAALFRHETSSAALNLTNQLSLSTVAILAGKPKILEEQKLTAAAMSLSAACAADIRQSAGIRG